MAREPGFLGCCRWFTRNITRWLSFFVAAGQITIWVFHFFSGDNIASLQSICRTQGQEPFGAMGLPQIVVSTNDGEEVFTDERSPHKPFYCIGSSLTWLSPYSELYDEKKTYKYIDKKGEERTSLHGFDAYPGRLPCGPVDNFSPINSNWFTADNCNRIWRRTFTFQPDKFLDLWTPFFFGAFLLLQHLSPDLRATIISGNWTKMAFYHVILALWGCFGYAGNLGVLVGFLALFTAFLQVILGLIHEDWPHPHTVIDLRHYLEFIPGCRKAPESHMLVTELQEARVSISEKDKEIAALKAQVSGGTASE